MDYLLTLHVCTYVQESACINGSCSMFCSYYISTCEHLTVHMLQEMFFNTLLFIVAMNFVCVLFIIILILSIHYFIYTYIRLSVWQLIVYCFVCCCCLCHYLIIV